MADSNSLGLDFEQEETAPEETTTEQTEQEAKTDEQESKPEKKKPYVNLERVKTGGPQRVGSILSRLTRTRLTIGQEKPTDEELAERIQRIREQNEKIKQRRLVSTRLEHGQCD